jgi:hypothetical protein
MANMVDKKGGWHIKELNVNNRINIKGRKEGRKGSGVFVIDRIEES